MEYNWVEILLSNGPMGIVAAMAMWMYVQERKTSKEVIQTLKEITEKYEKIVSNNTEAIARIVVLINERLPSKS